MHESGGLRPGPPSVWLSGSSTRSSRGSSRLTFSHQTLFPWRLCSREAVILRVCPPVSAIWSGGLPVTSLLWRV